MLDLASEKWLAKIAKKCNLEGFFYFLKISYLKLPAGHPKLGFLSKFFKIQVAPRRFCKFVPCIRNAILERNALCIDFFCYSKSHFKKTTGSITSIQGFIDTNNNFKTKLFTLIPLLRYSSPARDSFEELRNRFTDSFFAKHFFGQTNVVPDTEKSTQVIFSISRIK